MKATNWQNIWYSNVGSELSTNLYKKDSSCRMSCNPTGSLLFKNWPHAVCPECIVTSTTNNFFSPHMLVFYVLESWRVQQYSSIRSVNFFLKKGRGMPKGNSQALMFKMSIFLWVKRAIFSKPGKTGYLLTFATDH